MIWFLNLTVQVKRNESQPKLTTVGWFWGTQAGIINIYIKTVSHPNKTLSPIPLWILEFWGLRSAAVAGGFCGNRHVFARLVLRGSCIARVVAEGGQDLVFRAR